METYSINDGSSFESEFLGTLNPNLFLNKIPNNTSQLIVPEDVRDSLFTIWDNISFKQTTIPQSDISFISISGKSHLDKFKPGSKGLKTLIGKKKFNESDVLDENLVSYNDQAPLSDTDLFIYNSKPDDFGGGSSNQQYTKVSFLAGDITNNLFGVAPFIKSQENIQKNAIDFTIFNESGKLIIDADEIEIGSENTLINMSFAAGSSGIKTKPAGNPGDVQINLDDCDFGFVDGENSDPGSILLLGSDNIPFWGNISPDVLFTFNQILTADNQTLGENIIVNSGEELKIGDVDEGLIIKNESGENIIKTTGGLKINPQKLRLDLDGIGPDKILKTNSVGNAYWESQNNLISVQYNGGDFLEDPNSSSLSFRVDITNSSIESIDQIISFSINGVEVSKDYYIIYQENNEYYLSLDISQENGVGFEEEGGIEEDDLFFISGN